MNYKKNSDQKQKRFLGFTLVEMIVTITILAILGTIAFISIINFSGSARDGSRVSDIASISKSLEISYIKVGAYPLPDNTFSITYSGGVLWNQGTIGDSVIRTISAAGGRLSKKPTDPLVTTKEYSYSKTAYGNSYQIKSDWEGETIAHLYPIKDNALFVWSHIFKEYIQKIDPIGEVFAATGNPTLSYIKGNYNGLVIKTQTGGIIYALAVPSIITNETGGSIDILSLSGKILVHGKSNSGGLTFTPSIVYASGALPVNDTASGITNFTLALQSAYSGSVLVMDNVTVKNLLSASGSNVIASLGAAIISNYLGGTTSVNSTTAVANQYNTSKSLLIDGGNNQYLSRTPGIAGNRKTWTYSAWVKLGKIGSQMSLFSANNAADNANGTGIGITSAGAFSTTVSVGNVDQVMKISSDLLRDPSAWYHLLVSYDLGTVRMWKNGVEITSFSSNTNILGSQDTQVNSTNIQAIGKIPYTSGANFDGYIADVNLVDGQALTATSFGEYNSTTGQWIPKQYIGNFGTNGFHFDFSSGSSLGADSGSGNHWSSNGSMSAANNQVSDTPLNNFATLNPLQTGAYSTLSKGNLRTTGNTATNSAVSAGTISMTSGKWYWEVTQGTTSSEMIGVATKDISNPSALINAEAFPATYGIGIRHNGYINGITGEVQSVSAFSWITGDIIGVAVDADNGAVYYSKNGTWLNGGVPTSGGAKTGGFYKYTPDSSRVITPTVGSFNGGYADVNFGQKSFAFTPPTDFKSVSTANLPTPTIVRSNQYFDTLTWIGNDTARSLTDLSFQPDLVWTKDRSVVSSHRIHDSARGGNGSLMYTLKTDSNELEGSDTLISSFINGGFSLLGGSNHPNVLNRNFVAWNWKAGGSATTNSAGSITSQVSANPTAGFSIVTYTGNGVNGATIGHGLGTTPKFFITKNRDGYNQSQGFLDWSVYHNSLPQYVGGEAIDATEKQTLSMHSTNAAAPGVGGFPKGPASNVFTPNQTAYDNVSTKTYVSYVWSEVPGFSKFGSYIGNGSTDGPFISTGFRPKYISIKISSTTGDWATYDTIRDTRNPAGLYLYSNSSAIEGAPGTPRLDILSNGFKIRNTGQDNLSGQTYIYTAFAEAPFKYASAR